jgi:CRP-like cAMP-binding protein
LKLIAQEFQYKQGSVRSLQILQQMLSQLKYFSLFQPNQRLLICQEASYLCLPARQMIFKQDDLEDFMYIIVKGRVACEMSSIESGNLPIVIQVLGDGEAFGQLTYTLGRGDEKPRKREYAAVTTEETDVLVLNKLLMHKLQF